MTYQIQITPELKARLDALAAREGTTADAVAVRAESSVAEFQGTAAQAFGRMGS